MTPAVRAVRRAGIPYVLHEYTHEPATGSYGREAAEKLGVDPARVFKTLVVSLDASRLAVAIVPVEAQLDLKAVAAALNAKRATMAVQADAERATGYVVGGISPLGLRKKLPVVLDDSAMEFEQVLVSAGRRGLEIELAPWDLVRVCGAAIERVRR